ncbi:GGDEF domain-containing protein [Aureimonas endophytica]|uniref:diguanylate cyclase n=1 Tax=Aureimonas endophytica TaxID=2027858 RepID=A0A917A095_9HYPH|nr:GGDEF domain-containing protein [Aureimonas endophytica]GGE20816.1 GGDEF domain-containing protein [Aureimonas endophytica]
MHLHAPTIMTLMSGIALLSVIALGLEWRRSRLPALGWWALGYSLLVGSLALMLLLKDAQNFLALGVGSMLALAVYAVMLHGCRVHVERRPSLWLFLPPLTWFLLWCLHWQPMTLAESFAERRAFFSAAVALYCLGTVPLFWSRRNGLQAERWLAIAFGGHAVVYCIRLIASLNGGAVNEPAMDDGLLIAQMFEGTLFTVVSAALFLSLAREMTERRLAAASQTDFLTGVDNRHAFFDKAGALLARASPPAALAVLDLDHFKAINDRHGHAFGDEVLKLFARIVAADLAPGELLARTGGEEFALLLSGQTPVEAADRLRLLGQRFSQASTLVLQVDPPATFSAGLVAANRATELESLLQIADTGLYRAKHLGRNRVEIMAGIEPHRLLARPDGDDPATRRPEAANAA